jgi:XTP/dITP diphosphohydrolase
LPRITPARSARSPALLDPLAIEVVPQAELGIAEADEPHDTFLENALAKGAAMRAAPAACRR